MIQRFNLNIINSLFISIGIAMLPSIAHSAPNKITVTHNGAENSLNAKVANKFKDLIEASSKGTVMVNVSGDSKLFSEGNELEALQLGMVNVAFPSLNKLSSTGDSSAEVYDLPLLFPSLDKAHNVFNAPSDDLIKKMEKRNVKILGIMDNGFKILMSKKPINSFNDLKGTKIHAPKSNIIKNQFEAFGAEVISLSKKELQKALSNGEIDVIETTVSAANNQKLFEKFKYLTFTNHGFSGYVLAMDNNFYKQLPEQVKSDMPSIVNSVVEYQRDLASASQEKSIAELKKNKVQIIGFNSEALKSFTDKVKPMHTEVLKSKEKKILCDTYETIAGTPVCPNDKK